MVSRERLGWIAVDWGSSNLRAWAMSDAGEVLAQGGSDQGMLALKPEHYEAALLGAVSDWLPESGVVDVVVCGMAGARQGWREAAYREVPTRLEALLDGAVMPDVEDSRLRVCLLPGLCQQRDASGREFDVMRGEETQLAGLVALDMGFTGWACLPGTHAKWAYLFQGELARFQTFLTGELYRLLAARSVLHHSLGEDDLDDTSCREAFVTAVGESVAQPARFSQRLFGIRASDLLDANLPRGDARAAILAARLSGLAIGLELAAIGVELPPGEPVSLVGAEALCRRYALALETLEIQSRIIDSERAVLAGLGQARRALDAT
ncbi:2-dehydro-3-deoxygalactonokinase [Litchfieldella rifensis]|uniref:2-dehydro-3-deoxygalactonokinase n=1 Tax=Litchfieldella rifensis TaxID=762643 RepID=A0ABV7LQ67_9GAMM